MPLPSALTKFFLVFQIIFDHPKYFRFFQKKLDVPKKIWSSKKCFSSVFSYGNYVFNDWNIFLSSKMFFGSPNFFGHPNFFLMSKSEIKMVKNNLESPKKIVWSRWHGHKSKLKRLSSKWQWKSEIFNSEIHSPYGRIWTQSKTHKMGNWVISTFSWFPILQ